jgi:hypothetical protein
VEFALLDLCDQSTASELLELPRRAYRVEAELIGSFAIPALHETLAELQRCGETFLGAIVDGAIAGAISWRVVGDTIDLHRLIVDPAHFAEASVRCSSAARSPSSLRFETPWSRPARRTRPRWRSIGGRVSPSSARQNPRRGSVSCFSRSV